MAVITTVVQGASHKLFVQDFTSGAKLVPVFAKRTQGIIIQENTTREYVPALNIPVQAGNHIVTCTLTFLGDDDFVYRLSRSIAVSDSNLNDPPGQQNKYILFLAYPDNKISKKSFIFPEVYVDSAVPVTINYNKEKVTAMQIRFAGNNRDWSHTLITKGNFSTLCTTLAGQNPYGP